MTTSLTTTVTATNIRQWVGLKTADVPVDADIEFIRGICQTIVRQETSTSTQALFDVLCLMLTSSKVLKALASRSVKNGYISFNTGAGSVRKSPNELLNLAKDLEADYNSFVEMTVSDVSSTKFLGELNSATQQDFKDIMQGVNNAWDYQGKYRPSINAHYPYPR